jgi:hypothetical protein
MFLNELTLSGYVNEQTTAPTGHPLPALIDAF